MLRIHFAALAVAASIAACSSSEVLSEATGGGGHGASSGDGDGSGGLVLPNGGSGAVSSCRGLECQQVRCPNDSSPTTTTLTGTVFDPSGRVPLYNVVAYVPNAELEPISSDVTCEDCAKHFSGSAIVLDLSDAEGRFEIRDVPAGRDIPLVIQVGKWRRRVVVPEVKPCIENALTDPELTRLPRNQQEGNLPKIAVATGASDALECLLRRLGIDDAEFTPGGGDGRVHLYQGYGASSTMKVAGDEVELGTAEQLWLGSDLSSYDMMLLSCEGWDDLWEGNEPERTPEMYRAIRDYADRGGRIFGSHWHNRWIDNDVRPDLPYPSVVEFAESAQGIGEEPVTVHVDDSFPKGAAFRDWLVAAGASRTPGELTITKGEHSVDRVTTAQRWIYGTDPLQGTPMVQYFSFTTPVGEQECGRMVFSDVHVTFGGGDLRDAPFPDRCEGDSPLTPQELALAFMIFDLSSCIQKETDEPAPPVVH